MRQSTRSQKQLWFPITCTRKRLGSGMLQGGSVKRDHNRIKRFRHGISSGALCTIEIYSSFVAETGKSNSGAGVNSGLATLPARVGLELELFFLPNSGSTPSNATPCRRLATKTIYAQINAIALLREKKGERMERQKASRKSLLEYSILIVY